jgi:NAD(P)-dependent dehydrogenase (short-subunit alcohol dehydrogenase family)
MTSTAMTRSPLLTLNNGVQMPALGLGVFQSPPDETADAVESALRHVYRLIDRLQLSLLSSEAVPNSGVAYGLSKRANHLRVQAAGLTWGERGARVNCISPGIIATPMAQQEMAGPGGAGYRKMIETSASRRMGTPDDVAAAAAFLLGPESSFVTGADLLIDGGVIAALRAGRWTLSR